MEPKIAFRWYTTTEAAEILGVSAQTLHDWRKRGLGPKCHRLGRRSYRYLLRDLESYVQATEVRQP